MDLPIGSIILWGGGAIPSGWAVCNGENGTVNLVSRYVYGAETPSTVLQVGGASTHTHSMGTTNAALHNHASPYARDFSDGAGVGVMDPQPVGGGFSSSAGHTHTYTAQVSDQPAHNHGSINSTAGTNLPLSRQWIFIQRIL